jgi:hypothetical protein
MGSTLLGFGDALMSMAGNGLKKKFNFIEVNSIIIDTVKESGKRRLLVSRAIGKASKFLRGFKLRDRHGEDKFGGYSPCRPNQFLLGLSGNLHQDKIKIKVQDPGGPRIGEHTGGVLPGIIEAEGREVLFNLAEQQ